MAGSTSIAFAILAIGYFIIKYLNHTDHPKVKNLPEIPGVPLFGNLLQFGEHHAKVAARLAKKYGPVFQVGLGNRRIIFANTIETLKHLCITNQSAFISRPRLHSGHSVIRSSLAFPIGSSPLDESCKNRRK